MSKFLLSVLFTVLFISSNSVSAQNYADYWAGAYKKYYTQYTCAPVLQSINTILGNLVNNIRTQASQAQITKNVGDLEQLNYSLEYGCDVNQLQISNNNDVSTDSMVEKIACDALLTAVASVFQKGSLLGKSTLTGFSQRLGKNLGQDCQLTIGQKPAEIKTVSNEEEIVRRPRVHRAEHNEEHVCSWNEEDSHHTKNLNEESAWFSNEEGIVHHRLNEEAIVHHGLNEEAFIHHGLNEEAAWTCHWKGLNEEAIVHGLNEESLIRWNEEALLHGHNEESIIVGNEEETAPRYSVRRSQVRRTVRRQQDNRDIFDFLLEFYNITPKSNMNNNGGSQYWNGDYSKYYNGDYSQYYNGDWTQYSGDISQGQNQAQPAQKTQPQQKNRNSYGLRKGLINAIFN